MSKNPTRIINPDLEIDALADIPEPATDSQSTCDLFNQFEDGSSRQDSLLFRPRLRLIPEE